MKLSLQIISCRMPAKNTELYIADSGRVLLSARLLTPRMTQFDRSSVYIGKTSDILSSQNAALPENLICVGRGDIRPLTDTGRYNMMVVDGGVLEVHNDVQDIFDYYNQIDGELMNAILQEKELQSILNICTRFFDNPVYIMDAAQKLVSCSANLVDAEWKANLEATGYVMVDVVNALKKLDQLGLDAQMVKLESVPPFLSAVIYDKAEKVGLVGVRQLYSKISENQLSLLKYVAEVLTAAVSKENYARYVKAGYMSRFMIDMLGDADVEVSFIMHNLAQIGWKLDDDYYIFKIQPDPKDIAGGTVKYSGELIKNMFPGSVLLSIGDVLALVVNLRHCHEALQEAFDRLGGFLQKRNFICGVSMMFKDFSHLNEQYKLAAAAIELGGMLHQPGNLFRYEDCIMPHIISLCEKSHNVRILCHHEAVKLHAYDRQTNNNYFYCLYVYLLNEKSLLLSSKQLNIHRSTLIYRLGKIAELISVDLNDQRVRMHLILSYEILHFLDCLRG